MYKKIKEDYYLNFIHYNVIITYKKMRHIHYRYDPSTLTFKVSAPILASKKTIFKHLEEFAPGLIKRTPHKNKPILDNQVYIFGALVPFEISNKNKILEDRLLVKKKEDINKLLKKILMNYLTIRVNYYESLMDTHKHKLSIRNTKTRFGSNSVYSNRLSFSLSLVHFSKHLIDSVIMHELAHDRHYNHSKDFYNYLKIYSPDYKICKDRLDSTDFSYGNDIFTQQQKN